MQRRRKPKNEPRNIFDKGSSSRPSKSPGAPRRSAPQPSSPPKPVVQPAPPQPKPTVPPSTATPPATVVEPPSTPDEEETSSGQGDVGNDAQEVENETILEEQLLGTPRRKSRGLQPVGDVLEEPSNDSNKASSKAMEIIEASKARATANWQDAKTEPAKTPTAKTPVKPRPNRRRPNQSFQPASREKRLDRSRHMEYKYEVRGLLIELDVAEEHRSALLGTIWAKGERQTSAEARQYIIEKQTEGILNQDQTDRLMAVVDDYTIRR